MSIRFSTLVSTEEEVVGDLIVQFSKLQNSLAFRFPAGLDQPNLRTQLREEASKYYFGWGNSLRGQTLQTKL